MTCDFCVVMTHGGMFTIVAKQRHAFMASRGAVGLIWVVGVFSALLSGYGWWFYFTVEPTHGPGRELGIVAGLLSAAALTLGWRLRKRRSI